MQQRNADGRKVHSHLHGLTPWFLLLLGISIFLTPLQGAIFVPLSDEALFDQTPLIVHGSITGVVAPQDKAATRYLLEVRETLKGTWTHSVLTLEIPGRIDKLWIPGSPEFTPGDEGIFFLAPGPDSSYRIQQLFLGSFLRQTVQGTDLAVRDLSRALALQPSGKLARKTAGVRDFEAFLSWIRDRAMGRSRSADYMVPEPRLSVQKSLTPVGLDLFARWFEFDYGGAIPWYAHEGGIKEMSGGGFAEVAAGLQAWNQESGTIIRYFLSGFTSAASGFQQSDGLNTVLFEDPNEEIAGSFDCNLGGVLAIGGFWYEGATQQHNGLDFKPILEGDIITQDGAGCEYRRFDGLNGEEILGHEFGHTLGFTHSCGDSASGSCTTDRLSESLMRAFIHRDGRGAQLTAYDIETARLSYPGVDPSLDVDGDGRAEALSDGILIVRRLFGFTGSSLVSNAIREGARRTSPSEIEDFFQIFLPSLDIDGNGEKEALTDGLLILRYLFGFRGATLTQDAIGSGATRTEAAEIEALLAALLP